MYISCEISTIWGNKNEHQTLSSCRKIGSSFMHVHKHIFQLGLMTQCKTVWPKTFKVLFFSGGLYCIYTNFCGRTHIPVKKQCSLLTLTNMFLMPRVNSAVNKSRGQRCTGCPLCWNKSIHFLYPRKPSVRSRGGWSLSQWSLGERRGAPWTRSPDKSEVIFWKVLRLVWGK